MFHLFFLFLDLLLSFQFILQCHFCQLTKIRIFYYLSDIFSTVFTFFHHFLFFIDFLQHFNTIFFWFHCSTQSVSNHRNSKHNNKSAIRTKSRKFPNAIKQYGALSEKHMLCNAHIHSPWEKCHTKMLHVCVHKSGNTTMIKEAHACEMG